MNQTNTPDIVNQSTNPTTPELPPNQSADPQIVTDPIQISKGKNTVGVLLGIFALLLILGVSVVGLGTYLLSTDRIAINNQSIENTADIIALSIPFFPKTPKLVLTKAIYTQSKVLQSSFDSSVSLSSSDFTSILGSKSLDVRLKGYSDISDPKNLKVQATGNITKDFAFEVRSISPMLYFKITKLPTTLLSAAGINPQDLAPIMNVWASYDTSSLETEARQVLLQEQTSQQKKLNDVALRFASKEIYPKMTMKQEKLDGLDMYKIEFQPDDETLNQLGVKLVKDLAVASDSSEQTPISESQLSFIKNLHVTLWIDAKDFYNRKTTVTMEIDPTDPELNLGQSTQSPIGVSIVYKMSDFGKTVEINPPKDAIPAESLLQLLSATPKPSINPQAMR